MHQPRVTPQPGSAWLPLKAGARTCKDSKQASANGPRIDMKTWALVDSKLKETWSPQQISGYLLVNKQPGVSHESIYQRIYADKRQGGTLHLTLHCTARRSARSVIPDAPEGAPSPIKSRLICAQPSWPSAPALVTGRLTWSLGRDRSRHLSPSTNAHHATR